MYKRNGRGTGVGTNISSKQELDEDKWVRFTVKRWKKGTLGGEMYKEGDGDVVECGSEGWVNANVERNR